MNGERDLGRLEEAVAGLQRDIVTFCANVDEYHERLVRVEETLKQIRDRLDKGAHEIGALRDSTKPTPEQVRADVLAEQARANDLREIKDRLGKLEETKALVVQTASAAGSRAWYAAIGFAGAGVLELLKALWRLVVTGAGG